MDSEKKYIVYTAADIQQYFSGKLNPAEMYAMEKAALDDPFLADAMEGYDGIEEDEWKSRLTELKERFSNKQTAKVILMKPAARFMAWKIAAAILIIGGGIAITYTFTRKNFSEKNSIATVNKKKDPVPETIAPSGNTNASSDAIVSDKGKGQAAVTPNATRAEEKILSDSEFVYRPATADKKEMNKDAGGGGYVDDKTKGKPDYATTNAAPVAQQNNTEQYEVKSTQSNKQVAGEGEYVRRRDAPANRKFSAQVVGADGLPLPFANIRNINEPAEMYADVKGNFRLSSADTLLHVEIKSTGHIPATIILRSDSVQNKIILSEDALALKEKGLATPIITGYGTKRKAAIVPDSTSIAAPVDGWDNYEIYIANNLSVQNNILQTKIHGEVIISFEVQNNGAITNFKVDKRLCDECDEAALRVIKNGPGWAIKNGKKAIARVKVNF